ncbi:hypothetical protein M9H77_26240 [Catharanthus roseus]|uniref:Uncharacterized protein n=1 Tax=Catharanthus roseus TaxID=4058 RepID=A0ACC0A943_CATRO|nr:hypothetical protein M9H77_26240 [Catharanthus roseus]
MLYHLSADDSMMDDDSMTESKVINQGISVFALATCSMALLPPNFRFRFASPSEFRCILGVKALPKFDLNRRFHNIFSL